MMRIFALPSLAACLAACLVLAPLGSHAADVPHAGCMDSAAIPPAVLNARLLVFGEVHGTREVPQFLASYVCALAQQGRKVTLAIELPETEQGALDAFMASAGAPPDVSRLLATPFWRRAMQDGRSSAAMLHLYEETRTLRAGGADVQVLAIDPEGSLAQRDAAMAAHLRSALAHQPARQVVMPTGGPHAVRTKGKRGVPDYQSAIFRVADLQPLVLIVGTAGGTAWICQPEPASCGPGAWDVNTVAAPAAGMVFSMTPPSDQFDGVFYVGPTTASPPAVN